MCPTRTKALEHFSERYCSSSKYLWNATNNSGKIVLFTRMCLSPEVLTGEILRCWTIKFGLLCIMRDSSNAPTLSTRLVVVYNPELVPPPYYSHGDGIRDTPDTKISKSTRAVTQASCTTISPSHLMWRFPLRIAQLQKLSHLAEWINHSPFCRECMSLGGDFKRYMVSAIDLH